MKVTDDAGKSIRYHTLKREVDSNRAMYEEMLRKVREAQVISTMQASNLRVVDPAEPPSLPFKPDVPFSAGLGLFAGLLIGLTYVMVRESTDRSILAPGNTAMFMQVPELGVIPTAPSRARRLNSGGPLRLQETAPNGRALVRGSIELAAWDQPASVMADSFRGIMTSLLFSAHNGARPGVIAVTSAHPREGKTTVACNLGITLARTGERVLLVDGDGRAPRLADIFGLAQGDGLSELLLDPNPMNPARVATCVRKTHIQGLDVLPAGSQPDASFSHVYSKRVPELLNRLREQYDYVLIDTPPLLLVPDGRVFGRWANRVILVIRAAKTARETASAVQQRLAQDGTALLGTVLNDWRPEPHMETYYAAAGKAGPRLL